MDFWILFNIPHTVIYTYCSKYAKLYKKIYISVKFASIHWRFYKGRVIKLTEFMMLFLERAYTFESAFPRRKIFPSRRYFVWSEILPTSSLRHVKKKINTPKVNIKHYQSTINTTTGVWSSRVSGYNKKIVLQSTFLTVREEGPCNEWKEDYRVAHSLMQLRQLKGKEWRRRIDTCERTSAVVHSRARCWCQPPQTSRGRRVDCFGSAYYGA